MIKTKLIRNLIYFAFSLLIIIMGSIMTYHLTTSDEFYREIIQNNKSYLAKLNDLENLECPLDESNYIFDSLLFKFSAAFLMGTLISDNIYLRLGVI